MSRVTGSSPGVASKAFLISDSSTCTRPARGTTRVGSACAACARSRPAASGVRRALTSANTVSILTGSAGGAAAGAAAHLIQDQLTPIDFLANQPCVGGVLAGQRRCCQGTLEFLDAIAIVASGVESSWAAPAASVVSDTSRCARAA